MENQVSQKFVEYLKRVRKQGKVTVRELADAIGRSSSYISHLENGRIKSIDFDTAFDMLYYINEKSHKVIGKEIPRNLGNGLYSLLYDTFGIYPNDYWEKEEAASEARNQQALEDLKIINAKLDELFMLVVDVDQLFAIDIAVEIIKLVPDIGIKNVEKMKFEINEIINKFSEERIL